MRWVRAERVSPLPAVHRQMMALIFNVGKMTGPCNIRKRSTNEKKTCCCGLNSHYRILIKYFFNIIPTKRKIAAWHVFTCCLYCLGSRFFLSPILMLEIWFPFGMPYFQWNVSFYGASCSYRFGSTRRLFLHFVYINWIFNIKFIYLIWRYFYFFLASKSLYKFVASIRFFVLVLIWWKRCYKFPYTWHIRKLN